MASKLENAIYKTYKGISDGEGFKGGADGADADTDEDTSTVDTDTSEIMKRLEGEGEGEAEDADDEEGSIVMDSDDEEAEGEAEESDASDAEDDGEQGAVVVTKKSKTPAVNAADAAESGSEASEASESDTDDDEDYLQKLDDSVRHNIIGEYHPEMIQHNDEEVETLCKIVRDADGVIIDPFHKTLPFVTKYEKARILGERAKQINAGAKPFIPVEKHMIDGYLIALREFEEKKIPFIVRRPLPNGGSEYWKLADLQILD